MDTQSPGEASLGATPGTGLPFSKEEDGEPGQSAPPQGETPDSQRTTAYASAASWKAGSKSYTPAPGSTVAGLLVLSEAEGRYEEKREHARGGMGRVLVVRDRTLCRDVVLKELMPGGTGDPEATVSAGSQPSPARAARFLQEAALTGQLEHPSIVPVYELGRRADGTLYYTMKYVRGRTLAAALAEAHTLADRIQLLPNFVNLCQAVAYAHSRGVVHRDLKPQNVMLGEFGETVVIDWGLAKVRGAADPQAHAARHALEALQALPDSRSGETADGAILGTPVYMAPEQARGEVDQVDERSDVYALGTMLYEIAAGHPPFRAENNAVLLHLVANEIPRPLVAVQPDAPEELSAICERAMRKDPAERYQSARELADDVGRFLTGALVQAHTYTFADYLRRYVQRHRAAVVSVLISVALLLGMGIYSYLRVFNEKQQADAARIRAEQAQEKETLARQKAEAEEARAHTAESDAFAARDEATRSLYASQINLAQSSVAAGQYDRARRLLVVRFQNNVTMGFRQEKASQVRISNERLQVFR
jgi:serine/threonine protein kinase